MYLFYTFSHFNTSLFYNIFQSLTTLIASLSKIYIYYFSHTKRKGESISMTTNILNDIKMYYIKKYDLLGKKRIDPRYDLLGVFRHDFFLKPGYTEADYKSLPYPDRNALIDFSDKRWIEYCMLDDKRISQMLVMNNPISSQKAKKSLIKRYNRRWSSFIKNGTNISLLR